MTHRFVPRRTRDLAKEQRGSETLAEKALWRELRQRRCLGFKFRRQYPVGMYVADFACLEARLVIEFDGPVHGDTDQQAHDVERDAWLRAQGFWVLRFSNDLFLSESGELAIEAIRRALRDLAADPSSDPASPGHLLPQGEKGSARWADAARS